MKQNHSAPCHLHHQLLMITVVIIVFGLLSIYSSSSITAFQQFGDSFYFIKKQMVALGAGLLIYIILIKTNFHLLSKLALPIILFSFLVLSLTLFPQFKSTLNGASRWIRILGISFQPVEIVKFTCILFMAKNLSRPNIRINNPWSALCPSMIMFCAFASLLLFQPDLGSAVLLFLVISSMLFVANLDYRYFIGTAALAIVGLFLAIFQAPYRKARLISFLNPWQDIQNSGFQIIQSYLGFQNGNFLGLGIGESKQKLHFLPEAHTDFILAVIGEEMGYIGVFFIICAYIYLIWTGYQISFRQDDLFRKFLTFGLTSLIGIQTFINMGVTMGILPTKGMPLPFISAGASSLTIFMTAIAILAIAGKCDEI